MAKLFRKSRRVPASSRQEEFGALFLRDVRLVLRFRDAFRDNQYLPKFRKGHKTHNVHRM